MAQPDQPVTRDRVGHRAHVVKPDLTAVISKDQRDHLDCQDALARPDSLDHKDLRDHKERLGSREAANTVQSLVPRLDIKPTAHITRVPPFQLRPTRVILSKIYDNEEYED